MNAYEAFVPKEISEAVRDAIEHPDHQHGSFVTAVVERRWEDALRSADRENFKLFPYIMAWSLAAYPNRPWVRRRGE